MIAPDVLDESGLLKDIEVIRIDSESRSGSSGQERLNRIRDVDNFFSKPYTKEDDSEKKYQNCNLCS